jgi:predicted deacylase
VAFGLEYVEALDWLPGLFVAAANAIGIPAIEPEIGGQAVTLPERRMLYRSGCINLMRHMRILPGLPDLVVTPRDVRRCEQRAPIGGLLLRHVEIGQAVSVGQPLASITDLNGVVLAELTAAEAGMLASVRMHAAVESDDLVAMIFV